MIEKIKAKMELIFTEEELNRIELQEEEGMILAQVDLHFLSTATAKRFVKNIIALIRRAFRLVLIHGYVHGMNIKLMLINDEVSGSRWNSANGRDGLRVIIMTLRTFFRKKSSIA